MKNNYLYTVIFSMCALILILMFGLDLQITNSIKINKITDIVYNKLNTVDNKYYDIRVQPLGIYRNKLIYYKINSKKTNQTINSYQEQPLDTTYYLVCNTLIGVTVEKLENKNEVYNIMQKSNFNATYFWYEIHHSY
jgi:hypothetical protein